MKIKAICAICDHLASYLDRITASLYSDKAAPAVQETREQLEQPVPKPSGGEPPEGVL